MSKSAILKNIRQNKPASEDLPEIDYTFSSNDLVALFMDKVEGIGGKILQIKDLVEIEELLQSEFPTLETLFSTVSNVQGNVEITATSNVRELPQIDVALIESPLGIAENGAIWADEELLGNRIIPFLAEHLAVVLDARNIVGEMYEAYQRISVNQSGFGVFIAGPSKTADIEQSLVIGAQGARTFTIFLIV